MKDHQRKEWNLLWKEGKGDYCRQDGNNSATIEAVIQTTCQQIFHPSIVVSLKWSEIKTAWKETQSCQECQLHSRAVIYTRSPTPWLKSTNEHSGNQKVHHHRKLGWGGTPRTGTKLRLTSAKRLSAAAAASSPPLERALVATETQASKIPSLQHA